MSQKLNTLIEEIAAKNPAHGLELKAQVQTWDDQTHGRFESFWSRFEQYATREGKTPDLAVDAYLNVIETTLGANFQHSLTETLTGMMLAKFFLQHHNGQVSFFLEQLSTYQTQGCRYLEVAQNHWTVVEEVMDQLSWVGVYDLLDMGQQQSLAQEYMPGRPISFIKEGWANYQPPYVYDLMVITEVGKLALPLNELLSTAHSWLTEGGILFVTHSFERGVDPATPASRLQGFKDQLTGSEFILKEDKRIGDPQADTIFSYGAFLQKQ